MKVALLGNINNNYFSLMRYFRDQGIDAHLYLYANDGVKSLAHFTPENDTWRMEDWAPYIHRIPFVTGYSALVGSPSRLKLPTSIKKLDECLEAFTHVIGTGIAPALFRRAGKVLDIYSPHSSGVEFLGSFDTENFCNSRHIFRRSIFRYTRRMQRDGLQFNTRHVLNPDSSTTASVLNSHGIEFKCIPIPMVYNRETPSILQSSKVIQEIIERVKQVEFSVISHVAQYWVRPNALTDDQFKKWNKRNDWLVHAFAKLLKERSEVSSIMVLFEYGSNVSETKKLCNTLGVDGHVVWVPKSSRKEILLLLQEASVVVGEFTGEQEKLWGGAGWEALAAGSAFIQDFHFSEGRFEGIYGVPAPPLLQVCSKEDVLANLIYAIDNPEDIVQIGRKARNWFDTYNGMPLAKQWANLLN